MIELEKRKAIFLLHQEGMPLREISRRLSLGRNTVRRIIAQEGRSPARGFSPAIDPELLRRLHQECRGYVQRVWEKLQEEHGLKIKYSTVGKGEAMRPPPPRCRDRVDSLYFPACGLPAPGDPITLAPWGETGGVLRVMGFTFGSRRSFPGSTDQVAQTSGWAADGCPSAA